MTAQQGLIEEITIKLGAFSDSLMAGSFYMEMLMIGISVLIAMIMTSFLGKKLRALESDASDLPFDPQWALKPLGLLSPLLIVLFLSLLTPFAERYGEGGIWTNAAVNITCAYLLVRLVLLVFPSRLMAYFIATVITVLAILQVTGFLGVTAEYLDSIALAIGSFEISMLKLINGIVMLVVVFWVAGRTTKILEVYLRRGSGMSYNARELTVKIAKIAIYFTAIMITLSSAGIDLTVFAVFGGALGVGLGFGLQKITANFVSGIIALVEKSMQIGDLVEIGDVMGYVRQLNIRYTLLETFDGREVTIPNEELMTSRVTNWTHSNFRARVEVKVGVAYGSDVHRVKELLLEAASEYPLSIKDPTPGCFLREFGDSSLNFLLTFWVDDVREGRYTPQSEVMLAIVDKFEKEGISIPFPQRDLHMISGDLQKAG